MLPKQLRIAMLSVHSSPLGQPGVGDTGGMSIYIRELTRELVKQGHIVDIYTRVQDPVTPEIVSIAHNARQIHILAGEPIDLDKLLIYTHVPDFACKVENFRRQRGLKYDVIYSNYWISGVAGRYLQTWWRVPHLIMFHTLGAVKNSIGIGEDEPELRIAAEDQLAQDCDRIIASTENERDLLCKYYGTFPEKISIIPCGVNLDLFRPGDKLDCKQKLGLGEERIILFVGRIERLKGIDKIIQALSMLKDNYFRLLIVGEDGNRSGESDNLKKLAAALGVDEKVTFSGLVNYDQLPKYYNAADVCVFPSYYESFGLVPLESLACGTPVLATDVGDLRHIIRDGETGYVVPDNSPQILAQKLEDMLLPTGHKLLDSALIRSTVSHYDWLYVAKSLIIEIKRLIDKYPVHA